MARSSEDGLAAQALYNWVITRNDVYIYILYTNIGQALINEIMAERCVELWERVSVGTI